MSGLGSGRVNTSPHPHITHSCKLVNIFGSSILYSPSLLQILTLRTPRSILLLLYLGQQTNYFAWCCIIFCPELSSPSVCILSPSGNRNPNTEWLKQHRDFFLQIPKCLEARQFPNVFNSFSTAPYFSSVTSAGQPVPHASSCLPQVRTLLVDTHCFPEEAPFSRPFGDPGELPSSIASPQTGA